MVRDGEAERPGAGRRRRTTVLVATVACGLTVVVGKRAPAPMEGARSLLCGGLALPCRGDTAAAGAAPEPGQSAGGLGSWAAKTVWVALRAALIVVGARSVASRAASWVQAALAGPPKGPDEPVVAREGEEPGGAEPPATAGRGDGVRVARIGLADSSAGAAGPVAGELAPRSERSRNQRLDTTPPDERPASGRAAHETNESPSAKSEAVRRSAVTAVPHLRRLPPLLPSSSFSAGVVPDIGGDVVTAPAARAATHRDGVAGRWAHRGDRGDGTPSPRMDALTRSEEAPGRMHAPRGDQASWLRGAARFRTAAGAVMAQAEMQAMRRRRITSSSRDTAAAGETANRAMEAMGRALAALASERKRIAAVHRGPRHFGSTHARRASTTTATATAAAHPARHRLHRQVSGHAAREQGRGEEEEEHGRGGEATAPASTRAQVWALPDHVELAVRQMSEEAERGQREGGSDAPDAAPEVSDRPRVYHGRDQKLWLQRRRAILARRQTSSDLRELMASGTAASGGRASWARGVFLATGLANAAAAFQTQAHDRSGAGVGADGSSSTSDTSGAAEPYTAESPTAGPVSGWVEEERGEGREPGPSVPAEGPSQSRQSSLAGSLAGQLSRAASRVTEAPPQGQLSRVTSHLTEATTHSDDAAVVSTDSALPHAEVTGVIEDANPPASSREGGAADGTGTAPLGAVPATWVTSDAVTEADTAPLPQLELATAYDTSLAEDGPMPVAPEEDDEAVFVFLGGACNPTTWRHSVAMPRLEAAGVSYFNPQVKEWNPELIEIERNHKESAEVLLFVINKETHGVVSMQEAAEFIVRGRTVVLMLEDLLPPATGDGQDAHQAAERVVESLDKIARQDTMVSVYEGPDSSLQPVVEEGKAMSARGRQDNRALGFQGVNGPSEQEEEGDDDEESKEEEEEEGEGEREGEREGEGVSPASTAGTSSVGNRSCRVAVYTEDDDEEEGEGSGSAEAPSPPEGSSSSSAVHTPGHVSMQTQPGSVSSVSSVGNGSGSALRARPRVLPAASTPRGTGGHGVLDTPRSMPLVLTPREEGAYSSPVPANPLGREVSQGSLTLRRNVSIESNSSSGSSSFFARHAMMEGLETATQVVKEAATEMVAYKKAVVKDVNRGREYLRELAERHGACVYDSVEEAVEHVVGLYHDVERSSGAEDAAEGEVQCLMSGWKADEQQQQPTPRARSPSGRQRSSSSGQSQPRWGGQEKQDSKPPLPRCRRASATPGRHAAGSRQRRRSAPQAGESPTTEGPFPAARALAEGRGGAAVEEGVGSGRTSPSRDSTDEGGQEAEGARASGGPGSGAGSGPGGVWV